MLLFRIKNIYYNLIILIDYLCNAPIKSVQKGYNLNKLLERSLVFKLISLVKYFSLMSKILNKLNN